MTMTAVYGSHRRGCGRFVRHGGDHDAGHPVGTLYPSHGQELSETAKEIQTVEVRGSGREG